MMNTQHDHELSETHILFWAAVVGLVGGSLGLLYYFVLKGLLWFVWQKLGGHDWLSFPLEVGFHPAFRPYLLAVTTIGGFGVGLCLKYFGRPGEIAAVVDNIHMENGRIDPKYTPSMVACSLVSITAGGSAGPEAPLVQIIGSFGSWIGDKLKLRGEQVRTLTFCGMGTALGAFFGAPLGGALFALEIPHRRGLEYYEALLPTILSSLLGFMVFRFALGYTGAIYHLPAVEHLNARLLLIGLVLGLLGGVLGIFFSALFKGVDKLLHPLHGSPVVLATLGGAMIGIIAQFAPKTLFWGEFQLETIISEGPGFLATHGTGAAIAMILAILVFKILAVGFTLHAGFRGGFIFPLFFIGACGGVALWMAFPQIPLAVAALCLMAAVNVAVTKTPISTSVILTTLTGTSMLPLVVLASFSSFILTQRLSVIRTQRSRAWLSQMAVASLS